MHLIPGRVAKGGPHFGLLDVGLQLLGVVTPVGRDGGGISHQASQHRPSGTSCHVHEAHGCTEIG